LFKGFITPYARLGLGAGRYTRYQQAYFSGHTEAELDFAGQAAAGLALRWGPVLARGWAAPSLYGKDFVMVYGAGLGGRF
jgi:hypothetical protein